MTLNPPLGFGSNIDKKDVAKNIMKMDLHGDKDGCVFFNELLFAAMKNAYGEKIAK
jgi:hypothetical protein